MKMKTQNKYYEKANNLRFENLYREAVANYLNAILIDRQSAESYLGLGICYKNLGNIEKAIKYLETAAELRPKYYDAYFELGVCHQIEGTACGAIKSFIQAIQSKPDSVEAILQLGISHEICDEDDLALMIYQKLIENSPDFEKAYEHKASLLMKMNRYKEAGNIFKKLINANPEYSKSVSSFSIASAKIFSTADKESSQLIFSKMLLHSLIFKLFFAISKPLKFFHLAPQMQIL